MRTFRFLYRRAGERVAAVANRAKNTRYGIFIFFFFSAGFLRHPSRYVSTNACYRDRNDERARPRVRIGRASQRFWKIKFIAFVWPRTTTPRNGLSARKCEKYYVVARRFRHNFYDAAPAQRVGEYDDAEEGGRGRGGGESKCSFVTIYRANMYRCTRETGKSCCFKLLFPSS